MMHATRAELLHCGLTGKLHDSRFWTSMLAQIPTPVSPLQIWEANSTGRWTNFYRPDQNVHWGTRLLLWSVMGAVDTVVVTPPP